MKTFFALMFLFFSTTFVAQELDTSIDRIETTDQIFQGIIDEKYEITVSLSRYRYSEDHLGIYSVKGWYSYNSQNKPIPLVGIYNGTLTLYSFPSQASADSVLEFKSAVANSWQQYEDLMNRKGFTEKFTLDVSDYQSVGSWKNASKELKVSFSSNDLEVVHDYEFLKVRTNKTRYSFNLLTYGIGYSNYKVLSAKKVGLENRILLFYNTPSSLNVQGMCGAGSEKGLVVLRFDEKMQLIDYDLIQTESCHGGFYKESSDEKGNTIRVAEKEDYSLVKINFETITVTVEK